MILKKDILKFDSRNRLYNYILKNPGLHLSELSRRLKIPKTTLLHHIISLKKQNLIDINPEKRYKRIYISEKLSRKDKEILHLLRQEVPCKILLHLMATFVVSQIELSKELEKSPPTIEFHLKKLVDKDIIEPVTIENGLIRRIRESCYIVGRSPIKNEIIYRKKNEDITLNIYRILAKYGDSLPDQKTIAPILKFLREFDSSRKLPKRVNHADVAIDEIFKILYEICPHPYHV